MPKSWLELKLLNENIKYTLYTYTHPLNAAYVKELTAFTNTGCHFCFQTTKSY